MTAAFLDGSSETRFLKRNREEEILLKHDVPQGLYIYDTVGYLGLNDVFFLLHCINSLKVEQLQNRSDYLTRSFFIAEFVRP